MAEPEDSEEEGAETAEGAAASEEELTEGPLVVFPGLDEDLEDAESLESSLGRGVVVLDPNLLDAEAFNQLEDAAAIVVAWDLGTQAGLDVLEALRSDERLKGKPILMSSPEPTQASVRLALNAGASGFIFQPLGREELLPHMPREESATSTPADEDEGGSEDDPTDS